MASSLLKAAEEILKDQRTFKSRSLKFAYSFITDIGWCFSDLAMIKAITRAEIHWRKGRIPTIRFSPSTHAERAGGRIDGAISIRFKAIVSDGSFDSYFHSNATISPIFIIILDIYTSGGNPLLSLLSTILSHQPQRC